MNYSETLGVEFYILAFVLSYTFQLLYYLIKNKLNILKNELDPTNANSKLVRLLCYVWLELFWGEQKKGVENMREI